MIKENKKKLCIFSHYFDDNYIPFHVLVYINELKKYFDEFILVTNNRNINNEKEIIDSKTRIVQVTNEGYDFGMFYKVFKTLDFNAFEQIACVNDSNIVFGSLEFLFSWGNKQRTDFWGLVDSCQKPKKTEHKASYHIQSHFLVFNKKAIKLLPAYLEQIDFDQLISLNDKKQLRKKVIEIWEIGISQFLLKNKLKCKTYINSKQYSDSYYHGEDINVTIKLYKTIVSLGIPIIKRRVINKTKFPMFFKRKQKWSRLILKYADKSFQPEKIITELQDLKRRA